MTGTMFFPALLPSFQKEWGLNNTEAGLISGIFFAGYAVASPVLLTMTDRMDARRIYLPCAFLTALSMALFGFLAEDLWTAAFFRLLAGVGLAGTYMPGLKALSDSIAGPGQSRYIVFYTASYGVGISLSVYLAGVLAPLVGWRLGAGLLAAGPLAALAIFAAAVPRREAADAGRGPVVSAESLKAVLKNRPTVGYILAYGAHCWELFGYRSWLVAFLVFSLGLHPGASLGLSPQTIATLILLAGAPASVLGNELALLWERNKALTLFMTGSGLIGCLIGFAAGLPIYIVVGLAVLYGMTVLFDSGTLTAGLIAESRPQHRGLTLAVYSCAGFLMAFLAPLAFGAVLDLAGRGVAAWGFAFAALGIGCASGALWLRVFR